MTCKVSHAEMTADGVMRHPSFKGMRDDKSADQVVKEKAKATEKIINDKANKKMKTKKNKVNPSKGDELSTKLLHGASDTST